MCVDLGIWHGDTRPCLQIFMERLVFVFRFSLLVLESISFMAICSKVSPCPVGRDWYSEFF